MQYWDIIMPDQLPIGAKHQHRSVWLQSLGLLRKVGPAHRTAPISFWNRLRHTFGALLHFLLESFLEVWSIDLKLPFCCTTGCRQTPTFCAHALGAAK